MCIRDRLCSWSRGSQRPTGWPAVAVRARCPNHQDRPVRQRPSRPASRTVRRAAGQPHDRARCQRA
eukprot:13668585-Alexandrium_andersonii.AAC.1